MSTRILAVFVLAGCAAASSMEASHPVIGYVRSSRGFVLGQSDGQVDRFLGIPYAAAPVGDLRWKAPAEAPQWRGVRDATKPGSQCVQVRTGTSTISGDEDCLYLNVYRPASMRLVQALPVMIFIHGGSNLDGAGTDYDPTAMVEKGIVVVTINYRLNVFGFLAMPGFDTESGEPSSGNFGFQDQQAAMRWVRDNVAWFGGNPLDVTVEGESAGAIDICGHLTSPTAAGLFHRAIMESLYCPTASHEEALQTSAPVATALGCTDAQSAAACLRGKAAADVLNAAGSLSFAPGFGNGFNASPNYGNSLLPVLPATALATGQFNWSSILIGSNHDEAALFVYPALTAAKIPLPLTPAAYQAIVKVQFGAFAPQVLAEYPLAQYSDPTLAYADEITDYSPLGCPVTGLSNSLAALTETFRYEFDDPNAPTPGASSAGGFSMGAFHGSELQYLFKVTLFPGVKTTAQEALARRMVEYWANFIQTGNPNGAALPNWPRYEAGAHSLMSLRPSGDVVVNNFDDDHHCAFWAASPGPPFRQ